GRIARLGGVPVHGKPHQLRQAGGLVAVVQRNGAVSRLFECKSIEGPKPGTLANGVRSEKGYLVVAKTRTLRTPREKERERLSIRWYAIGQFRYFDPRTWRAVVVTDATGDGNYLQDDGAHSKTIPFAPFRGGIPGCPRGAPEAALVTAYVTSMRQP